MPGRTFTGVPVFQAQGLTVKTENSRYTPLFLAKEDLDVAVGAAFSQREAAKEVANKSKASAAEEEVASARAAVRSCCPSYLPSCIDRGLESQRCWSHVRRWPTWSAVRETSAHTWPTGIGCALHVTWALTRPAVPGASLTLQLPCSWTRRPRGSRGRRRRLSWTRHRRASPSTSIASLRGSTVTASPR